MRADLTITGTLTLWISRGLEALGVDVSVVGARAGLDVSLLRDPDARVPLDALAQLWVEAERASGDALVGLHAGERAELSLNHVLAWLVASSRNLRDGLLRAFRYDSPLLAHGTRGALEDRGDHFVFRFDEWRADLAPPRHHVEFMASALARFFALVSGGPIELREVDFHHPFPGLGQSEYERVLGCPVRFGRGRNALAIPRRVMLRPSPNHSPEMIRNLEAIAEQDKLRIGAPSFAAQLRGTLRRRLAKEPTNADSLAASFHVSVRTLQRRLEQESASYSGVLDDARRELSLDLLRDGASISAVAEACGYANPRSFVRAFRRWTGETPSARRTRPPRGQAARS